MSYDDYEEPVGYAIPPRATRFKKGQSGNLKGRPPGRKKEIPYEAVLGQTVTIREGGVEQQVTAAEAFLLKLTKEGLEGNDFAARASLHALEEARRKSEEINEEPLTVVVVDSFESSGSSAMFSLRMARKMDRYRPTAYMKLEPWIVQAALDQLDYPLTVADQKTVLAATRMPRKVDWPDWWLVPIE